jgi:DNA-binding ferritin-like protein
MDRILNLSAFGDVIEKPKGIAAGPATAPVKKETSHYNKVFSKILQNMAQTKLLHWQSAMYGQHKALDGLFEGIIELGDKLAETVMGKYGRPVLSDDELCLKMKNFENAERGDLSEFMTHLYQCYSVDCRTIFEKNEDSEIINILDEILSLVDQTKYLLSLR